MDMERVLTIENFKTASAEMIKLLNRVSKMNLYMTLLQVQNDLHISENIRYLGSIPQWSNAREILDLGCGPGDLIGGLACNFADKRYTGVDKNRKFISQARKKLKASSNCIFFHANLNKFEKGRFDFVILRAVLQHLPDPGRFMRRLPILLNESAPVLFFETTRENFVDADPPIPAFNEFYDQMEKVQKKHTGSRDCIAELEGDLDQYGFRLLALDTPSLIFSSPEHREKIVRYLMLTCSVCKRLMHMPLDLNRLLGDLLCWYETDDSRLSLKSRRMLIERA